MGLKLIAAMSLNQAIGIAGKVPWHYEEDSRRFRELTTGGAVIMGANTFALDLEGKCLKDRLNIVLCHPKDSCVDRVSPQGDYVPVHSKQAALEAAGDRQTWVIGGAGIYELFLPDVDELFICHIHNPVPGDTYFPPISWKDWLPVVFEDGQGDYSFVVYKRSSKTS
ncbi:MAG: dihydrofolate reductase [Crinalium sp.]